MADQRNPVTNAVKECSACGHNSTTYKGSFIRVPREEDKRRMWLTRLGLVEDDEPLPIRTFFVCQEHFDMIKDFKRIAGGALRLRSGTLPWRKLANGERSYHGLDDKPSITKNRSSCACRCCLKRRIQNSNKRQMPTQTNDFDLCSTPAIRNLPIGAFLCWLCRGTNGLKALFSGGTALFPVLLDQIYTVTGILLNATQNEDALICKGCQKQVEQSNCFRLRARACFGPDGKFINFKKSPTKLVTAKSMLGPKPAPVVPNPQRNVPIPVRNVPKPVRPLPKVVSVVVTKPGQSKPKPIVRKPKPAPEPEPDHLLFEVEPLDEPEPEAKRIKLEPPGEEYELVGVKTEPMEKISIKTEQ